MSISKVGIISDTHGLLREEALEFLTGSDLIIHAGDVGDPNILDALKRLATVVAVRGNIDDSEPLSLLPSTAILEAGASTIYVLHRLQDLDLDPVSAQIDIVISGHSHKPSLYTKSGVLYLNPGSAGPKRFHLPTSLALLETTQKPASVRFVDLLTGSLLEVKAN